MERAGVENIVEKLKVVLNKFAKENNLELEVGRTTYSEVKLTSSITFREKSESGTKKFSDYEIECSNLKAKMAGVKFVGDMLGSKFMVDEICYHIVGFTPRSRKYCFLVNTSDGRRLKSSVGSFKVGSQLVAPTITEFKKWLSIEDIEDDRISREDEEIYNKVNDWVSYMDFNDDVSEAIFELIDKKTKKLLKDNRYLGIVYNAVKAGLAQSVLSALTK